MNKSIQKEIAAPQDCKRNLLLILVALGNLFLVFLAFFVLEILRRSSYIDSNHINVAYFVSIIIATAIVVAILLKKYHTLMLTVLTLAALDSAALMIYHSALNASGIVNTVWRMTTIVASFTVLIFTLLFLGIYFSKPRVRNPAALSLTKYLTYCAMLTALAVISKMIGNAVSNAIPFAGAYLKFTFVYIPWVIGGLVLGPIGGFAAAAIGDFIGQLAVSTGGMPLPELILSNGLFAVFPALIFKILRMNSTYKRSIFAILIGTIISVIICTLGITTYTLYNISLSETDGFFAYLVTRLPQLIIVAINIALMLLLTPSLIKAKILKQPITKFFD